MALRKNDIKINIDARTKKRVDNPIAIDVFKKIVIFKIRVVNWLAEKTIGRIK